MTTPRNNLIALPFMTIKILNNNNKNNNKKKILKWWLNAIRHKDNPSWQKIKLWESWARKIRTDYKASFLQIIYITVQTYLHYVLDLLEGRQTMVWGENLVLVCFFRNTRVVNYWLHTSVCAGKCDEQGK